MRDKKRIDRILGLLKKLWKRNPDWRFGQLLINFNIIKNDNPTWQTEDDVWENFLEQQVGGNK
jgi:hypothetical protein